MVGLGRVKVADGSGRVKVVGGLERIREVFVEEEE